MVFGYCHCLSLWTTWPRKVYWFLKITGWHQLYLFLVILTVHTTMVSASAIFHFYAFKSLIIKSLYFLNQILFTLCLLYEINAIPITYVRFHSFKHAIFIYIYIFGDDFEDISFMYYKIMSCYRANEVSASLFAMYCSQRCMAMEPMLTWLLS